MRKTTKAILGSAALCAAFVFGWVVALSADEVVIISTEAVHDCQLHGGCVMLPRAVLHEANRRLQECAAIDSKGRT